STTDPTPCCGRSKGFGILRATCWPGRPKPARRRSRLPIASCSSVCTPPSGTGRRRVQAAQLTFAGRGDGACHGGLIARIRRDNRPSSVLSSGSVLPVTSCPQRVSDTALFVQQAY